jgi:hypothetical protein
MKFEAGWSSPISKRPPGPERTRHGSSFSFNDPEAGPADFHCHEVSIVLRLTTPEITLVVTNRPVALSPKQAHQITGVFQMKSQVCAALLLVASIPAIAGTPCDKVKGDIAAKLDAKHVAHYTLEAVPSDQVADRKVVGSCEGGTKKIVYTRGADAAAAPASDDHH